LGWIRKNIGLCSPLNAIPSKHKMQWMQRETINLEQLSATEIMVLKNAWPGHFREVASDSYSSQAALEKNVD
jgi:hypothetical protein